MMLYDVMTQSFDDLYYNVGSTRLILKILVLKVHSSKPGKSSNKIS